MVGLINAPQDLSMSTTDPKKHLELLEFFSIALSNGLIEIKEVIKWADDIIKKDTEPDYFFIELSLSASKKINDVTSLINNFIGEEKPPVSSRAILGLMFHQYSNKKIPISKVLSTISWLCWNSDLTEDEKRHMWGVEEDYDLADSKIYGTVENVIKKVERFLDTYRDFRIDNFSDWPELTKSIGKKLEELNELILVEEQEYAKTMVKKKWWKFTKIFGS